MKTIETINGQDLQAKYEALDREIEARLAALVEQYFGTEFHTYTEDNITPKPEWY